jgi:hypothetical protein
MSSELAALIEANTRIEGIGTLDRLRGLHIRAIANGPLAEGPTATR